MQLHMIRRPSVWADQAELERTVETLARIGNEDLSQAPDAFALTAPETAKHLLRHAGFAALGVRDVQNVLKVPAGALFDFFFRFSVRIALIYNPQKDAVRRAIRANFERAARAYRIGDEIRVPMPSLVLHGQKPETVKGYPT